MAFRRPATIPIHDDRNVRWDSTPTLKVQASELGSPFCFLRRAPPSIAVPMVLSSPLICPFAILPSASVRMDPYQPASNQLPDIRGEPRRQAITALFTNLAYPGRFMPLYRQDLLLFAGTDFLQVSDILFRQFI